MKRLQRLAQVQAADAEIRRYATTLAEHRDRQVSVSDLIVLDHRASSSRSPLRGKAGVYCHVGKGGVLLRFGKTSGTGATGMHRRPFSAKTAGDILQHGYVLLGIVGWCIESEGFDHPEKPLLAMEAHLVCIFETPMNAGKDERTFNFRRNRNSFGSDCGLRFRVG
ncbi:MAG: hypothetical protein KDB14_05785 [Planctomycetales bacterium]|nr:hypothetical protein [Planctomycetales bacterium]